MTAKNKKRAPAKRPAPKTKLPVKEPAAPDTPDDEQPTIDVPTQLVEPLNGQVLSLLMQIIDNTDFKGREINQVIAVKLELARVAGIQTQGPVLGNDPKS